MGSFPLPWLGDAPCLPGVSGAFRLSFSQRAARLPIGSHAGMPQAGRTAASAGFPSIQPAGLPRHATRGRREPSRRLGASRVPAASSASGAACRDALRLRCPYLRLQRGLTSARAFREWAGCP